MDFNGNLLTLCGKTNLRVFLSWIAGYGKPSIALFIRKRDLSGALLKVSICKPLY